MGHVPVLNKHKNLTKKAVDLVLYLDFVYQKQCQTKKSAK